MINDSIYAMSPEELLRAAREKGLKNITEGEIRFGKRVFAFGMQKSDRQFFGGLILSIKSHQISK